MIIIISVILEIQNKTNSIVSYLNILFLKNIILIYYLQIRFQASHPTAAYAESLLKTGGSAGTP